jgi:transposase, IS5 family
MALVKRQRYAHDK